MPPRIPDLSGLMGHFGAEVLLALAIPGLLLLDLLAPRAKREYVSGAVAVAALLGALFLCLMQPAAADAAVTKLLRADGLAKAFRLIAIGTGAIGAAAALLGGDAARSRTEFFMILLTAVLGACVTVSANEMALFYLGFETLSIGGYLLAGFRRNQAQASEAAMKYVIFGAISSGMMLYGLTLLYGFAGTSVLTTPPGADWASVESVAGSASGSPAFLVGVVLVFAGLAYKIAAFPFQFWCPDVYQGAPTSVAGFLAVAGKGAGFGAALRFVAAVTGGGREDLSETLASSNDHVRLVLVAMSVITMTVGNVAALRQENAKRLLAYSAIAHAGYLLMGVAVTSGQGATALLFYMAVYLFMTLGAFFLVAMVERERKSADLAAFEGLGWKSPLLAVCLGVCLIGLTGLPPTGGFVGKFLLFREVFAFAGARDSQLYLWFGVIGLLNGVVSLAYYAKFLKAMYLADRSEGASGLALGFPEKALAVAMALPVLLFGVAFTGLYGDATSLAQGIFHR